MSETEFLTADELAEVTGYKHVASQREWLDKNGWPYVVNASGRPDWAVLRTRLGRPGLLGVCSFRAVRRPGRFPRSIAAKAGRVGAQDPCLHLVAPFNFSQVRAPAMPSMPVMRTMRASTSSSGGGFKLAAIQPAACMPFQPHTSSG